MIEDAKQKLCDLACEMYVSTEYDEEHCARVIDEALEPLRKAIRVRNQALAWCSGPTDCHVGGRAYADWLRVVWPLLEEDV